VSVLNSLDINRSRSSICFSFMSRYNFFKSERCNLQAAIGDVTEKFRHASFGFWGLASAIQLRRATQIIIQ